MNEIQVKNLVLNWYQGTNEHIPVAELEQLLFEEVKMSYPNTAGIIEGRAGFRQWYAGVLARYFDEIHQVEAWHITITGNTAVAQVTVRWETRSWPVGERISQYQAFLSQQRFVIQQNKAGEVLIYEKHVETFDAVPALYGPAMHPVGYWQPETAIHCIDTNDMVSLQQWLQAGGNANQYAANGFSPLLWAAVRGNAAAVTVLLTASHPASVVMPFLASGALPIHFAGHAGDVATAKAILEVQPDLLNAVWPLNGHTLLLQAVFYNHLPLAAYALEKGADVHITTARGLNARQLAQQFDNKSMIVLLAGCAINEAYCQQYYQGYLQRISVYTPAAEQEQQQQADELITAINAGFALLAQQPQQLENCLQQVQQLLLKADVPVNRPGGSLQQPPLVVAVTGNNGQPPVAAVGEFRSRLVRLLLQHGATPLAVERHPMGVNAFIRAAVFNHLEALQQMGAVTPPAQLAAALQQRPAVNGLTLLHDTVLRAGTIAEQGFEGYLQQIQWAMHNGADAHIADFSGRTPLQLAAAIADEKRKQLITQALQAI